MAKLTLNVDADLIDRAKKYAVDHRTSVSKLVTRYLTVMTEEHTECEDPPILRRLRGSLKGAVAPDADYRDVLAEKYR